MADFPRHIQALDGEPSVVLFVPPSDHPLPHVGPMPVFDMFVGRRVALRGPGAWWDHQLALAGGVARGGKL